jgi:long-chain acyl-CoA synthetase
MDFTTINEMFLYSLSKYGNSPMYFSKDSNKDFQGVPLKDLFHKAQNVSLCLMEMGLEPGDKIGLMSDNRFEWALADIASLIAGGVNVPRGSDSTPQEIEYILSHSGSKFCFVEHEKLLSSILPIIEKTPVEKLIVLDPKYKSNNEKVLTLTGLIEKGETLRSSRLNELEKRTKAVKPDDLLTIIYTSGTTGQPKGVMLTHKNMVYNVTEVPPMIGLAKSDKALSILPVWHIFERAMYYGIISCGIPYHYTNIRDLRDDFVKVKPTFMASAPRLWENIYMGIKSKLEKASPIQRMMFESAYEICKNFKEAEDYLNGNKLLTKEEEPFERAQKMAVAFLTYANLAIPAKLMDALVFAKVREALGGNMRGTISGGGALPLHVDEFFNVIGIPVYEGYGMTECAPIISARTLGRVIQASVGFPPKGTEVKILNEKGEEVPKGQMGVVHVKGPQVMKGYYKNEEATSKALNNGWLNTGDLGFISFNNTLSIRGRAKDTIVLLGGENVEPTPIENLLLESPLINQVIVVGQDQKTLTALIWPDYEKMADAGLKFQQGEDLNKNAEVKKHFDGILKESVSAKNGFKSFERLSDFRFLPKAMEVGDEITNLFKMKRNVITQKYEKLIKEMYI